MPERQGAMIPVVIVVVLSLLAGGVAPGFAGVAKQGLGGKVGISVGPGELPAPGRVADPLDGGALVPEWMENLQLDSGGYAAREVPKALAPVRRVDDGARGRSPPRIV